jgi:hypothetical protein
VVVIVNYIVLVLGFTAVLTLDAKRQQARCWDVLCCLSSKSVTDDDEDGGAEEIEGNQDDSSCAKAGECFSTALLTRQGKIIVGLTSAILLIVSFYGISLVEVGLPLTDIVPKDHYSSAFLDIREQNYHSFQGYLVLGMNANGEGVEIDYGSKLRAILDLERELQGVVGVSSQMPINSTSWVDAFIKHINENEPEALGSESYPGLGFLPDSSKFYTYFLTWLRREGIGNIDDVVLNGEGVITAARILIVQSQLFDSPDMIVHINGMRAVTDAALDRIPTFMYFLPSSACLILPVCLCLSASTYFSV